MNADVNDRESDVHGLVSEPAACPFCVQPEFGITYEPPSFRRGLTYVNQAPSHPLHNASPAMSSSSSLASAMSGGRLSPTDFGRRRTTSISATSPAVITTDRIRPDWHQKLAGARAHAARRSAAATALHTAAYLMGNRNHEGEGRGFGGFGRRGILRRATGTDGSLGAGSAQLNMLALMSERYAERYASSSGAGDLTSAAEGESSTTASPRGTRRSRMDDLEEMMMMEAIRMSLASEEERRKREDKDAKKEAKKKDKENKKAEKMARKAGLYRAGFESTTSESSLVYEDLPTNLDKGKGVQQTSQEPLTERSLSPRVSSSTVKAWPITDSTPSPTPNPSQDQRQRGRAQLDGLPITSTTYRPSHLRNLSNASSSESSVEDSAIGSPNHEFGRSNSSFKGSSNSSGVNVSPRGSTQDTYISGTAPVGGTGIEPMFNFRSLAAMVGEDEKAENMAHSEKLENRTNEKPHNEDRQGKSSTPVRRESDMGDGVDMMAYGPASLRPEDRATHVAREDSKGTPELKITSPTRANSSQIHGTEVDDVKAMEANVLMNSARPVS